MAVFKLILFLIHAVTAAIVSALLAVASHMLTALVALLVIGVVASALLGAFGLGGVGFVLHRGKRKN